MSDIPAPPLRRLAVVMGAGGMAMAIARRLGQRHRLLLADIDRTRLEQQVALLADEGHEVRGLVCDVTDRASVAALADQIAAGGGWSALAHVVGLSPSGGLCRTILSVNLLGAAQVAQAMLPVAVPGAAAVFVSSLAGHTAPPEDRHLKLIDDPLQDQWVDRLIAALGTGATPNRGYQLSKLGLIRMCRRLAATWGSRQARILSLSPGLIASPMGRAEAEAQSERKALADMIPLKREGSMIEIADAIAFLVSDRASFITGTDLLIDGGVAAALEWGAG